MKKRWLLLVFMLICVISTVAVAESSSIIDNVIIDMNSLEPPTSLLSNIQVTGDNDGMPIESQPTEDDDIFSEIGGIVMQSADTGVQLMSNTESDDYTVTLTFDLTNTSSKAVDFHVYVAVYEQSGKLYSVSKQEKTLLSTQKQQMLFKLTLENDGKDKTGKIFVWDENMLPTTSNGSFEIKNGNPDKLPNLTIDESMIINSDRYYNNVTLNSGTLDLNGHKFYINGDLIQSGGTVYVNNGELVVNGNYRIQKRNEITDQYGNTSILYDKSLGILNMTNENDRVLVNGDFYMQSGYNHREYLTNGVLEIKGNFSQIGTSTSNSAAYNTAYNFDASKNHKVVFSGSEEQSIYFECPNYSGFADAEFKNTKINIKSNLRGWVLKRDTVIDNDVNYSIGLSHTVNGNNGMDLHGYKLEIKGNYIQEDGTMYINGGSLVIGKDYRIQTRNESTDQYGNTSILYDKSLGILNMTNENDRVLVNGDFYMQSGYNHREYLTNGVLEIKGNFSQIGTSTSNSAAYNTAYNFDASKNHKVVFSGSEEQSIYFECPNYSGFADAEFKNTKINIKSNLRGWVLKRDTVIDNDVNYSIGLSHTVNGHNGMDLHGYKLEITGSYVQSEGKMYINGGSLTIGKDYRIQTRSVTTDQYGDTAISYDGSSGILNMTNENDRVLVNGDFYMQSGYNHREYLTNGVLEIKGNFSQIGTSTSNSAAYNTAYNFDANGSHKVVLSGNEQQSISFEECKASGFRYLELENQNVKFLTTMREWILTKDTVIDNDVVVGIPVDLHGYQLHIKGDYVQGDGIMYINNGSLIIDGDYRIQKGTIGTDKYGKIETTYSKSYGRLKMTNTDDRVLVNGDFYTDYYSHTGLSEDDRYLLTDGVFELKGDFTQLGAEWNVSQPTGGAYSFCASNNHKIILSGSKHQSINFECTYSQFNILILTKPYETGYTFNRVPCWNTLYQADAVSINYGGQTGTYAPTGNYSREFTDMTILSSTGDMAIKRTYNSQDEESSVFNQGWTLSISARLTDEGNGYKQVKLPDGSTAMFKEENGAYEALNSRNTLVKNEDGTYSLVSKSQVKYVFSSDGKIISMQDRYGNSTAFETNSDGNITSLTEPSGKRYSFTYSDNKLTKIKDETAEIAVTYEYSNGRLAKAVNPAGVNTYYEYDNNGRLAKILDHDRNIVEEIAYNSDDKVEYVIDADGNKSVYAYDLAGGKTTITDSNGRQKIQWFDSTFSVTKNQDAEGGITATEYNMTNGMNKYNEPRAVTDRNGRNTYYERDGRGNVIRQSNPDGSYKIYTYDENNNIISERDENGNYTYYVYDDTKTKLLKQVKPLDGITEYSEAANQELFAITEYTYYDNHKIKGLVKSKTEPEGLISEFDYDDSGMLKSLTVTDTKDGTSAVTKYSYNKSGLLEYEISPDGYKTTYEYDSAGNPTKLTVNNGNSVSIMQYDAAGRKIKEISPNEYALNGLNSTGKTYSYYPSGRIKSETDALGNSTEYTYDLYGNIQTETKPDGSVYKYEYDGINRNITEYFKDKSSADFVLTSEYSYSINSSNNSETTETVYLNDTESISTTNEFDYAERLIRQTRADGTEIIKEYDDKGNIKFETDANGNIKEYKYNALDMLIQEKIPFDGNYQYKKYSYDKAGNCIKEEITNQASGESEEYSITEYGYNSRGLLTMTAAYDNGEIKSAAQFVYDNAGNKVRVYTGLSSPLIIKGIDDVTETGDSNYSVRKYEYDYSGNIIKAIDAMGTEESYSYDNNGNCISYTDRNGNVVSYEYDIMNHLTKKFSGDSSYSYTYDSMGNKIGVSGDYNAGYTYDSKGSLLSEETGNSKKLYSYDLQGNRTGFILTYGEGEKLNMSYSYDDMGRVSQVLSNNDLLASYGYDNNGNRIEVVYDNGCSTAYSYNYANLVTEVLNMSADEVISKFDYTYYMDGRQKSKTDSESSENYTYDDLGRLISVNDTTYDYDDYNNRIKMNDTSYSYDKNGRLIGDNYSYDNNGNLLVDENNNYTYDVWNRLIDVNGESYAYDDLTGRISVGETNIISDGINVAYTSDGITEKVYLNGVNPIAVDETEERKYYFFNAHGDVVNLTDDLGDVVKNYSYDVFGNEINVSDDTNPIRYAGQYYDSESGNYYMNSRYYNAETGRFLSQDSFYGSDEDILSLNQYTYCYNDPIQYVDLSGNSVLSAAKKLATDSLQKAAKDTLKEYLKDQYTSAIGIETEDKNYFGEFGKKAGKNILKGAGKNVAKKLGIATEYSVFLPVIEDGIKNVTEEFNSSQKENRDFSMGNVVGNTASGVVLSYVKSAPGVGAVYDMCLDLTNGEIFKNLTVKTFTKSIDAIADSMGYEPINWNAGSDLYKTDSKQFSSDYNNFRSKGWSNNTSYWYALTQSYSRKVQRGNSWLRNNGYIK